MGIQSSFFHKFNTDISSIERPTKFTFPFCYTPHPLSTVAAEELQEYLLNQNDFDHNFGLDSHQEGLIIGKMFGILVVESAEGELGYLAASSGKLGGTNNNHFFVPPIFDMLDEDGFFIQEENQINALNREIERLEASTDLMLLQKQLEEVISLCTQELASSRIQHKANKAERKKIRIASKDKLSPEEYTSLEEDLIKQSYRDQHEYDVLKSRCREQIANTETELSYLQNNIADKKELRKQKSSALQNKLFDQYHFLNAQGKLKSVLSIFHEAIQMLPPAGAGECAAPKLLQYAYREGFKPVSLAEFWWGASPASEIRRHTYYYPSCRSKCEPILGHMLLGLDVDDNPMLKNPAPDLQLEVIFEDSDIIVINKPAEFLSVPGINIKDSVATRIADRNPDITGPMVIHRLDMSTSGVIVLAKNKEAHQLIQDQFIRHTVEKRYTALLEGAIEQQEGVIDLPLRVDLDDRPRQIVCYQHGKPAQTKFKVLAVENNRTRIHYFPLTGRTHQLRVHSAHISGLNCPIVGDDLYGVRADRLHLHAGKITFIHPSTKQTITFEVPDPF